MKSLALVLTLLIGGGLAYADENLKRGLELYSAKRFGTCATYFRNLLREHPGDDLYWFNFGNCSYMNSQFAPALKAYRHVIAMHSKLQPAAQLYAAKCLSAMGQTANASNELKRLLSSHPPQGIAQAAQANLNQLERGRPTEEAALNSYRAGKYEEAEHELRSLPPEGLSPDGRLLLGMTLLKERKRAQAEREFNDLLRRPLPPETRTTARDLLNRARRSELEVYPYWLFAGAALGWTSNAYVDGRSVSPVSSPLLRLNAGTGYHFLQGRPFSVKTGYAVSYEDPTSASELSTLLHTILIPLIWRQEAMETTVTPFFQDQVWNGREVSRRTGANAQVSKMMTKFEWGAEFEADTLQATSTTYSYLHGTSYFLRPYFAFWREASYFQLYLQLGADGTHDISYTNGSVLPLQQSYAGFGGRAIWRFSDVSSGVFNIAYSTRAYKNHAQPGDKERDDQEIDLSLKYNRELKPKFKVYGLMDYLTNTSTLGPTDVRDKNYDVFTLMAGVTWDVF